MHRVSGFKRCGCRDDSGRSRGGSCPRLRRQNGSWNPSHGTWYGKAEIPPGPDGRRASLRAGGFGSETAMLAWFDQALTLLAIPGTGPGGHAARREILGLIAASRKARSGLPDPDEIRRRYQSGASFSPGTTGDYLLAWLSGRREAGDLAPTTMRSYERAVARLFLPALGDVPLDRLGH